MRVVLIGQWFHGEGDDSHLRALAGMVDLTVYGNRNGARSLSLEAIPPDFCAYRELHSVRLTRRVGPRLSFYRHLEQALDADRPDVVHVLSEPWQLVAVQAARWAVRHPATALVVHSADRNWRAVSARRRLARSLFLRRTFGRADGFVSLSSGGVREAEWFGLPDGVVTAVVHNHPRSPEEFRPAADESERKAIRRQFGLPEDGTGVVFLGRLSKEKGPLLFLDAVEQARTSSDEPVWGAIAGEGPLQDEVVSRALASNVSYLGQMAFPSQVAALLRGVDILVIPSVRIDHWEEQGPRAAIEGLLSGCVVVGTPVGALPEMLEGAGVMAEGTDAACLAEAILRACQTRTPERRAAARRRAIEAYSGESAARALVDVWECSLAARRGKERLGVEPFPRRAPDEQRSGAHG
jgi:glycosyltransferase involved in cell wall biosynthesis